MNTEPNYSLTVTSSAGAGEYASSRYSFNMRVGNGDYFEINDNGLLKVVNSVNGVVYFAPGMWAMVNTKDL